MKTPSPPPLAPPALSAAPLLAELRVEPPPAPIPGVSHPSHLSGPGLSIAPSGKPLILHPPSQHHHSRPPAEHPHPCWAVLGVHHD